MSEPGERGTSRAERGLDRASVERLLAAPPAPPARIPRAAPLALRVDDAIAWLENAQLLAEAPVPRFILSRDHVAYVRGWLVELATPARITAAFTGSVIADPLRSPATAPQLVYAAVGEVEALHRRTRDPLGRPLTHATWDRALAAVRAARVPLLVLNGEFTSFELAEAVTLPAPITTLRGLTPAETYVLAWLQKYRGDFEAAELEFLVDRRGMAGAIAWEALFNPRASSPRSAGPGKIHLYEFSKEPVAAEVEQRGLLPARSYPERRRILATPEGAIRYVGAILAGFAQIAAVAGFAIASDPGLLANCYNAFNLAYWERHLARKTAGLDPASPRPPLELGNAMGRWVRGHVAYLEEGVGAPLASFAPR